MSADAARMVHLVLIFLLFITMGTPASAGAWLREKGSSFTAISLIVFKAEDDIYKYKSSLYAEWGLRPKLTIGLDAEEHQDLYGHALVFARVPVADFGQAGRLAAEFGVGAHHRQYSAWAMYKATLSYGKGIQTGLGAGWINVDTALEYRTHEALIRKLDFTTGLSSGRRLDPLLQIETSYVSDRPWYWSVRPSLMYRPKTGKLSWIVGAERNSAHDHIGFKFALWRSY
ncbi:hypothetical protein [uncultured Ruegeria sp.]|uniref:hypothetical protein n=1 Tax=uncultured Ruegeria sp. TaxID=259304 RepID=UPI0026031FED|nr:hypothetical protein [uncultured Ruegeria sp.]